MNEELQPVGWEVGLHAVRTVAIRPPSRRGRWRQSPKNKRRHVFEESSVTKPNRSPNAENLTTTGHLDNHLSFALSLDWHEKIPSPKLSIVEANWAKTFITLACQPGERNAALHQKLASINSSTKCRVARIRSFSSRHSWMRDCGGGGRAFRTGVSHDIA